MFNTRPKGEQTALLAKPEPSVIDRYNGAQAVATQARSSFLIAAIDLETAARDHELVAQLAQEAIDDYTILLNDAEDAAVQNRAAAKAIRGLVEPDQLALF